MHRLFVAIRPPVPIRDQLLDLMEGVDDARWQDEEQLHLTLRFIGEVDRHCANEAAAALESVRFPAFEITLNGLGSFDRRGRSSTLWAGVTPHEPLKALHRKIDQALQQAGIEPDRRAYLPHITLARLGRTSGSVRTLVETFGGMTSPPFRIDHFRLYESDLSPKGAIYTTVERYGLG